MIVLIVPFLNRRGMALFPFVLLKNKLDRQNPILINHEKIHLRQQLELLILPFYLMYFFNYIYNLILFSNHYRAYRNIIFEKEAYSRESEAGYLEKRKPFAFMNYLK